MQWFQWPGLENCSCGLRWHCIEAHVSTKGRPAHSGNQSACGISFDWLSNLGECLSGKQLEQAGILSQIEFMSLLPLGMPELWYGLKGWLIFPDSFCDCSLIPLIIAMAKRWTCRWTCRRGIKIDWPVPRSGTIWRSSSHNRTTLERCRQWQPILKTKEEYIG